MKTSKLFDFRDETANESEIELVLFVGKLMSYKPRDGKISFLASMNPSGDIFRVDGLGEAVLEGEVAIVRGQWCHRSDEEMQLRASRVEPTFDTSAYGATECLVHRKPALLKAREACALRDIYGNDVARVLDDVEALILSGLEERRAKAIVAYRSERRTNGRLLCFLQASGLSTQKVDKILSFYEGDAARVVFAEPWRLVRDIEGIGFSTADKIARAAGGKRQARARIMAGLTACNEELVSEGNVCVPQMTLIHFVSDRLGVSSDAVASLIEPMAETGAIAIERVRNIPTVYLPAMHAIEIETARDLASRINRSKVDFDIDSILNEACSRAGVTLHENQREAVAAALSNRVSGMTGGPGSGKTMTIKVIIEAMKVLDPGARIMLAAPTGRASQRLAESTGMEARTIHKMLEWSPADRGFMRDKSNPLECDMLVVDEFSMVDARLARDLLRALPKHARFVIVGDRDQLPSVGAGEVLADIIASEVVPVIRLTKIFRQQDGSSIARIAAKINAGEIPNLPTALGHDVLFRRLENPEDVPAEVMRLIGDTLPGLGYDPMEDVQVITPGHNHNSGTQVLNKALQDALNPPSAMKEELAGRAFVFRLGDRVMQTRTSYELGVFNGEIGRILEIDAYSGSVSVMYGDRVVEYPPEETNGLTLAYATTVHRSQGSEYPVVIVVATFEHANMLRRRLLYTAVTRARKLLVVVGQESAMRKAVRNDYDVPRYTGLTERLREQNALRSQSGAD